MDERESRNQIPCIVDEGIVSNRRDMVRILRDLGHVRYTDIFEDRVRTSGEGYVMRVFAKDQGATIVVNKRLNINVNGFDYLRLSRMEDDSAAIDLIDDRRTVRLVPLSDPITDRQAMACEALAQVAESRYLDAHLAEVFMDEDGDEPDEG
ncbi:MAG TPA: hypothetical protein V6D47_13185 [Oscillatoriaceae cyanobacterium]